ncbi:hypothetical protein GE21DRAFT_1285918 [Neurospora crassa]|nr:hypothetical protein GE21DRAFT_1285918 [Neurospora crassa]
MPKVALGRAMARGNFALMQSGALVGGMTGAAVQVETLSNLHIHMHNWIPVMTLCPPFRSSTHCSPYITLNF